MAAGKQHKVKHRDENTQGVLLAGVVSNMGRTSALAVRLAWAELNVGYRTNGNKRNAKWMRFLETVEIAILTRDAGQRITHVQLHPLWRGVRASAIIEHAKRQAEKYSWDEDTRGWVLA